MNCTCFYILQLANWHVAIETMFNFNTLLLHGAQFGSWCFILINITVTF